MLKYKKEIIDPGMNGCWMNTDQDQNRTSIRNIYWGDSSTENKMRIRFQKKHRKENESVKEIMGISWKPQKEREV